MGYVQLFKKIKKSIHKIEKTKGTFKIKCLVAKKAEHIHWDLILAADWFELNKIDRLEYLTENILKDFDVDDMKHFSEIITIQENSYLGELLSKIQDGSHVNNSIYDNEIFMISSI